MRKIIIFIFSIILLCVSLPLSAMASYNDEVDFESNIVYLASLDNGTVIFDKNADLKTSPASLTKVVTAMVVLENCKNLNEVVTTPTEVIRSFDGLNSSNAGIVPGEEIAVIDLLKLMLIKSANEAASILAYHIADGDIDKFVDMMNDYVKSLGCENSHFKTPHGLDTDGQYTTARDLAKIVTVALKNETFEEITSTNTYYMPANNKRQETRFYSTNFLISPSTVYYYEYAKGIKTGTTETAGCCLISTASKNGYTYLAIVLQGPNKDNGGGVKRNFAFLESKKAYEWAFKNIKLKVVASPKDVVTVVDVKLSRKTDHVRLVPKEETTGLIPTNVDATGVLLEPIAETIPESINAPIKKGDVIGKARVMYAGQELQTIDLVAGEDVSRNIFLYIGYLIKTMFQSTIMKIIGGVVLLLVIFYIVVNVLYARRRKKKRLYVVKNYRDINKRK